MSTPDERTKEPPPVPLARRRLQFSLRTLFLLTVGVAACFSFILGMPDWLIGPLFWTTAVAIPPLLLALLVWGGADQRAFAWGAILPSSYLMFGVFRLVPSPHRLLQDWFGWNLSWEMRSLTWSLCWVVAGVAGVSCVLLRRGFARKA